MITTRFGSEIEILEPADSEGWVKCKRVSDGAEREWHCSELAADTPEERKEIYGEQ